MTPAQVAELLGIAATFDNRIAADAETQARAWAALLDDVPYPVAEQALRAHYRRTTDTIMPAHIVEHWRTVRRENAERRHNAELRAHHQAQRLDETRLRTIRSGITRVTAALAAARGLDPQHAQADAETRRSVLAVACPYCHAKPGHPCTGPGGRPLTKTPAHPARLDVTRTNTTEGMR